MRFCSLLQLTSILGLAHGWVSTPLRVARPKVVPLTTRMPLFASVIHEPPYEEPVAFFPSNDTSVAASFASTLVAPSPVVEAVPAFEIPQVPKKTTRRGRRGSKSLWEARLQVLHPVTWVPPTFAVVCGAAASGNIQGADDCLKILAAMVLAGPFWEGFAQTMDAWTSGEKPKNLGTQDLLAQVGVLVAGGLGLSMGLNAWADPSSPLVVQVSMLCFLLNFLYVAPPANLQQKGWMGDMAARLPNMALPWICGQAVMGSPMDKPQDFLLPVVCAMAQLGPAILNDLVVPEHKIRGAPSTNNAPKWVVVGVQDGIQLAVAAYLASIGEQLGAAAVAALVVPQMFTQRSLLFSNLLDNDTKAFLFAQPFIYMGYLATALSIGHYHSTMM